MKTQNQIEKDKKKREVWKRRRCLFKVIFPKRTKIHSMTVQKREDAFKDHHII
jgi:hypothetical protein